MPKLDEYVYKTWLYYNVSKLIKLYGIDKVRKAVHKMEDKYENKTT